MTQHSEQSQDPPAVAADPPAAVAAGQDLPADGGPGDRLADAPDTPGAERLWPARQLVPVNESIRYRRRAQEAERKLAELQQQLAEQHKAHGLLAGELAAARRRAELTRLLAGRGVIDLEAAIVLSEQRLAGVETPDLAETVEQLLKDKPYLLASAGQPGDAAGAPGGATVAAAATMTTPTQGRRAANGSAELLRQAAVRAADSGRPADMDQYLRMRRRFV